MKTILTYLCLLLCLSPSIASNGDDLNCEGCTAPPTLVFDNNCQIRVSSGCAQITEWWLIPPGGGLPDIYMTSATTFTFNIDGPGVYRVIYASQCDGAPKKSLDLEVSVDCSECAPPEGQLDFIWANASNSEPTDCALTFTPVFTGTGVIEEYQWTFSNGTPSVSNANTPTVSFPQNAISAEVCLTISLEAAGGECPNTTICKTVPLNCNPCDGFTARLDYELEGCLITLDGSSSSSGNANIIFHSYAINGTYLYFGGYAPTPRTHQFSANGVYEVCVRILDFGFDSNGQWTIFCEDEICETVIVTGCNEPCIRENDDIVVIPSEIEPSAGNCAAVRLKVSIASLPSEECNDVTYYIDYGDGNICNISSGECGGNPYEHEYEDEGIYTICVYGFDECGCYVKKCVDFVAECEDTSECSALFTSGFCSDPGCDSGEPGACLSCFSSALSEPSVGAVIVSRFWEITVYDVFNNVIYTDTYNASNDEFLLCYPFEAYFIDLCLTITDSNGCTDRYCFTTSNGCLPIQEEENPAFSNSNPNNNSIPDFSVFPNPSTGQFSISSANDPLQSIEIYTLNGQQIWQNSRLDQTFFQYEDTPLAPGTYLIRATTKHSYFTQKLIVLNR